jgi:hypothetical protein
MVMKSKWINKYKSYIASFLILNLLIELVSPTAAWALTSGPSQPEVQEFQAINVSDMVDPSTGDLSYNIPLLDVDGYPVNLSYRAGISMDQEATYVGLGWNMNVGSIARNLRGIPDEFDGDKVTKKMNLKDNISYGINIGIGGEVLGTDVLNVNGSLGVTYNNYTGYDFVKKIGFSLSLGSHASVGLGLNSSADGLTISPNLSLSAKLASDEDVSQSGSVSLGTSFNSRSGMSAVSFNVGTSTSVGKGVSTKDGANNTDKGKWARGKNGNSHSASLGSIGRGSSYDFGSPTFIPQINMPMRTLSVAGSFKLGGTIFGVDVTGDVAGSYSKQKLETKSVTYPAYGYLHLDKGQDDDQVMLDFNREKDGNFTEATTNLPIPNLTYDNYSVMGQGVGGAYRPFRSDVGYVFDARANTTSDSYNIGAELSLGATVQGGIDFVTTSVDGSSGKWTSNNNALKSIRFNSKGYLHYEPAYFKEMGEMNVDDDPFYTNNHEAKAVRYKITDVGFSNGLSNELIDENSSTFFLDNRRDKRIRRNQLFSYLTVAECEHLALQTSLYNFMAKPAVNNVENGHHIGQITTTKTDGTRYVYGLPLYNHSQKEVSFNVSGFNHSQYDANTNMVIYSPGSDDTPNNTKGIDNFFTSTETPRFTYAHLLTAVLSSDYVDKTGNGPTPDDAGTYTLFNYDLANAITNYKWRTPFGGGVNGTANNYANLDEGLLSNKHDNKASYVYGSKEIVYLKSIESKNHIAVLQYSNRDDGYGVPSDAGGIGNVAQKKLDLITLYSKPDFDLYLSNPTHTPFIEKQVHLVQNYELCKNTYNSNGAPILVNGQTISKGKLTLKEVYFTYGTSAKGKLTPYKFTYNTTITTTAGVSSPVYNPAATNRWGTYKENDVTCPNSKYPYVDQNKVLEDQNVALWSLKSIQLPSGGVMDITYESDDYGYIQNKRAGEMFKIEGVSNGTNTSPAGLSTNLFSGGGPNTYLYFKLKGGSMPNGSTTNDFISDYLGEINLLYFRFYTQVNCGNNADLPKLTDFVANPSTTYNTNIRKGYEFVHGYAEIDRGTPNWAGFNSSSGLGWVKVKEVRQSKIQSNTMENPISKAAWQMARTQTPRDAYQCTNAMDPAANLTAPQVVFKALADGSFINNIIQTFQGYNGTLKGLGLGQQFVPRLSWVRLNNPDYKKLGGGIRVKEVKITDKWNNMLSNNFNNSQNSSYGLKYDYTTKQNGRVISSGVASYEPTFGADENTFRQPVFMDMHKQEALLAPDNDMYVEEPMGEVFFPSPSVVYSSVSIKSLVTGAGKTVNEYYTARDFPTIVHSLGMEPQHKKTSPIFNLFSFVTWDKFTGSQGYSIEVNDMHGKAKAVHQFQEGVALPKTSTIYHYKRNGNQLVNTVKSVFKDGSIKDAPIGIDADFYADFRENNTVTQTIGVNANLYFMLVFIAPVFIPSILPSFHREEIELQTAVTNKVIYKYGILDRTEVITDGNIVNTENLLYDAETGQPIVTGTTTEFKDPIYTTSIPGHWAYEGLAGGYKNTGAVIAIPASIVNISGQINDPASLQLLTPGDEIAFYPGSVNATIPDKGYIDKLGNSLYFTLTSYPTPNAPISQPLDVNGLSGYTHVKVVRSGRHNLQDQKVGALTSFISPLNGNPSYWPILDETYRITQATAVELGNRWQGYCGCDFTAGAAPGSNAAYPNQYIFGIKGNMRKIKDYTYLTNRTQTKLNGNSNIRIDGMFTSFKPFWTPNSGNDWVANPNGWQWVTEATRYSPYGYDLENKDALNRYSGAQYGYQQTMPVAVTANSQYKQAANESFEYNELNFCADDHFGFNQHRTNTYVNPAPGSFVKLQKYAHTGKRSVKVGAGQAITVTKQINTCKP